MVTLERLKLLCERLGFLERLLSIPNRFLWLGYVVWSSLAYLIYRMVHGPVWLAISLIVAPLVFYALWMFLFMGTFVWLLVQFFPAVSKAREAQRNLIHRRARKEQWYKRFTAMGLGDEPVEELLPHYSATRRVAFVPVSAMPKLLYKYRDWSSPNHKQLLTQRNLYIPSPTQFNDPFDCRLPVRFDLLSRDEYVRFVDQHIELLASELQDDREFVYSGVLTPRRATSGFLHHAVGEQLRSSREARELFSRAQLEAFGVLCFSEEPENILMLSHYANSHRGYVVGLCAKTLREFLYDSRDRLGYHVLGFNAVRYVDELPVVAPADDSVAHLGVSLFFHKASGWSYEREWRVLVNYYAEATRSVELPPECFREIYLGCNVSPAAREEIIQASSAVSPSVEVFEMSREPFSYKMSSHRVSGA